MASDNSVEVQDILSQIPSWFIRSGNATYLFVLAIIILFSNYIKYPETIEAQVTITSPNPPVTIYSRASGVLTLFIRDGEIVNEGDILGWIKNPLTYLDFVKINTYLNQPGIELIHIDSLMNLGTIQEAFNNYITSCVEHNLLLKSQKTNSEKLNLLYSRIEFNNKLQKILDRQIDLKIEKYLVAKKNFERDSLLEAQGVIAISKLEQTYSEMITQMDNLELNKERAIANRQEILSIKSQIIDAKSYWDNELEKSMNILNRAREDLFTSLEIWKETYLITASKDGEISLIDYWSDGHHVNVDDGVLKIIPKTDMPYARALLPVYGAGKAELGTEVQIELYNYPYQEYGRIEGSLKSKSLIPKDNKYICWIEMPNGLVSKTGKQIPYDKEMVGNARFIVERLSLLQRVFRFLKAIQY